MKGTLFMWFLGIFLLSSRVEGDCKSELGIKTIPDKNITASSSLNNTSTPAFARLDGVGAWCSAQEDHSPFIQIVLDEEKLITAITIQGSYRELRWVTQFQIKYLKEEKWLIYDKADGSQNLQGNIASRRLKKNILQPPVITRTIRIYPKASYGVDQDSSLNNVSCLRLELYGCSAPVDGGWGKWSDWSECSVTCGDGKRSRERKCDSPKPQNGGRPCDEKERVENKFCHEESCTPVNCDCWRSRSRIPYQGSTWGYSNNPSGSDRVDAINFQTDGDVILQGYRLWGVSSGSTSFQVTIRLYRADTLIAERTGSYATSSSIKTFEVLFSQGISIRGGVTYTATARIVTSKSSFYLNDGMSSTSCSGVTVTFKSSSKDSNSSDRPRGQIPALIFRSSQC